MDYLNKLFKDIYGNEDAIKFLQYSLKEKRIAPAYLFHGEKGLNQEKVAKRFAEGLLLDGNSNQELSRKLIESNNHPDLLYIEPSIINKGKIISLTNAREEKINLKVLPIIRIEQIRDANSFINKKSIKSNRNVVIIDGIDLMNEASSNALLKTLEEPNNSAIILISNNLKLILPTIKSRCQLINFKPLSINQIYKFIEKDKFIESEDKRLLANNKQLIELSNGSPGKLIDNIRKWNAIDKDLVSLIKKPINNIIQIINVANQISNLPLEEQILLIEFLQLEWWRQTNESKLIEKLEILKKLIGNRIQPRLAWEVCLLEIKQVLNQAEAASS